MTPRFNIEQLAPEAYNALLGLEMYNRKSGLDKNYYELIKVRASQINGCAFCLDMHTRDARKLGETEQRIYVLNAWRDTNFFTPEEQAVLTLTEEMTNIQGHVSDETYNHAVELLGLDTTLKVIMANIAINSWNRLAITGHFMPPLAK